MSSGTSSTHIRRSGAVTAARARRTVVARTGTGVAVPHVPPRTPEPRVIDDGEVASMRLMHGKFSEDTMKRYADGVRSFTAWCRERSHRLTSSPAVIDRTLAAYINDRFVASDGAIGKARARNAYYGVIALMPSLRGRLPLSYRFVLSWHRLRPAHQHPPLTWDLTVLLARTLYDWGYSDRALGMLLAFDCMLRVGELCALRRRDVGDDGDGRLGTAHEGGVVLRLGKTKTGLNQSVRVANHHVLQLFRRMSPLHPVRRHVSSPSHRPRSAR